VTTRRKNPPKRRNWGKIIALNKEPADVLTIKTQKQDQNTRFKDSTTPSESAGFIERF